MPFLSRTGLRCITEERSPETRGDIDFFMNGRALPLGSNDALIVIALLCVSGCSCCLRPVTLLDSSEACSLGVWEIGTDLRGPLMLMMGGRVVLGYCEDIMKALEGDLRSVTPSGG